MTNENGSPPDADELPAEDKTVNQVVAWNVAYYRKAAGITQEQLGELIGRSKRNISADERSWDGGHTREFNAHELARLASAFGIPVGAFFLPPDDDGIAVRYRVPLNEDDDLDMAALMELVMPDNDYETRVMGAYRYRISTAVGRYLGPSWADEAGRWRRGLDSKEARAEEIEETRADRQALVRLAAKLGRLLENLEKEDET